MINTVLESRGNQLERFQDALDAAKAKGPDAYAALFDSPPDGLSVHEIDTAKVLVRVSRAHERLLGYAPARMTGQPVASFIILKEVSEMAMNGKVTGIRTVLTVMPTAPPTGGFTRPAGPTG